MSAMLDVISRLTFSCVVVTLIERDCVHGRDQDDWLQAERELVEKYHAR